MASPHDRDYLTTACYVLGDNAWHLELEDLRHQRLLVSAVIPDEDPAREPVFRFEELEEAQQVPYEVMRRFTDQVEEEIRSSRAWMRLRPELVAVVHHLRQEHAGWIDDEDLPGALAGLRASVPEADLPAVLAAAFERALDGTELDRAEAFRIVLAAGAR
ncbi:hypothetical protein ACIA8O_20425 [Kitasatospora sp. NPDC051853]|uniref:hypothetical protein n=1 Tax=Kitasatospora sp. NPDC051853 TaxID=3364058 RepID=UPI003787FF06